MTSDYPNGPLVHRTAIASIVAAVVLAFGVGCSTSQAGSAPTTPSPSAPATSAAPTVQASSSTPEPEPEFPFNEGEVAEMQEQSYARFKQNPKPMRVSYFLSAAYEEVYNNAEYTSSLDQVITHEGSSGEKIYHYLPYGGVILTQKSSAQDILNSYAANEALLMAIAEGDPDQANKLISGVVSSIDSQDYRDFENYVRVVHNLDPSETGQHRLGEKTINGSSYSATDHKVYTENDPATDKSKTFMKIISKAGYIYTFEFYSVPEIGAQAEPLVEDSGIWLLARTTQL